MVAVLARDIGVRSFQDLQRLTRTADYIGGQLASFGYDVTRQTFHYRDHSYDNLIAELNGTSTTKRILVIGAHYDAFGEGPAADDNASGVAALLELATGMVLRVRFVSLSHRWHWVKTSGLE